MITSTQTVQNKQSTAHLHFNAQLFQEQIERYAATALEQFKDITRQYAVFHITFFTLACLELLGFALFFSFLTKSTILAFSLAGIFLTGFSYFVLLFYLQAKKPEQLLGVRHTFLTACQSSLPFEKGNAEFHHALSAALNHFLNQLHRQEYHYYSLPQFFKTLAPLMQKFSVWCHWKDLHQMKEFLLMMKIKENVELVKIAPTDLESHSGLAQSYQQLAKHYQDPRIANPRIDHLWVSPEYLGAEMQKKFEKASWRAIEEYKILDHYAPNEPWVHSQLASIYHDLSLPAEEIKEYEAILKVSPHDRDTLFHLGTLYFEQGLNAQGLKLYEQLKKMRDAKAEDLLSCYDIYIE
jgi:hypothetical protein